ncbi:bifunctional riboflavin kinase/FAD synthetase [Pseudobacteriovorax antillogorgiicola]|uniref:Riboflavin biosynthesis protein n=1 Tax=Pseudobacteriovorax antillogorgiicola TaxID=1513793 RepID=A0A1Y6B5T4_9BACT|nr:bifunctional riboflavin kinase/FAD synthetase [Pseudobacteriovorax antillogorgiicola]TCS59330.1 FMN adenylyltransferase /riboflavin kinase [Pseudobacteriovorax antillogorgiicola]SME89304.1 FMN adenylyltransferase /riboflavin kinase [Pseudobacteriovorax antillogorgiicola]
MKVFDHIQAASLDESLASGTTICIGNFDGCHLGHQKLIQNVIERSQELGTPSIILTFEPSPKVFFDPHQAQRQLVSQEQKLASFRELGVDIVIQHPFDASFSQISPESFVDLLKDTLHCRHLYVGKNFHFGKNRSGNTDFLKRYVEHFEVCDLPIEPFAGEHISSTRIRSCLEEGDAALAHRLLGRPYALLGSIKKGQQLGRTLAFPTANLQTTNQLIPKFGVYAGFVWLDGEGSPPTELRPDLSLLHPTVFNIGVKPTVDGDHSPSVEGHILDKKWQADELYQQQARYYLTNFIRDEIKFPSLDALREQIGKDCETARMLTHPWER